MENGGLVQGHQPESDRQNHPAGRIAGVSFPLRRGRDAEENGRGQQQGRGEGRRNIVFGVHV